MWPDKISPESVAGEKYQGYCFLTNMPGTKGDPKSSETIGIEKKIIAENVNVSVNVNRTIEIF